MARICMCASRRRVESVCGCARGVHVHASLVELRACVGAREARMCMLIGVELRACVGAREACMCVRVVVFREHVCLRVWCACAHESAQLVHTAPHCSSCCGRARASGLVPRLVHAAPFFVSLRSCACRRAYVSLGACGATLRIVVVVRVTAGLCLAWCARRHFPSCSVVRACAFGTSVNLWELSLRRNALDIVRTFVSDRPWGDVVPIRRSGPPSFSFLGFVW